MSRIQEKLDAAREELLDLSLRNKLLNYRLLKSRGVEVIDERSEEEIGDNLSLRARLRGDLGLRLPELPEEEDVDVPAYFDRVEEAVADLPRWRVGRRRVRTHADTPEFSRTLDRIAPEEIVLAIETVVERAFGMTREEIPATACTLLGFKRNSGAMRRQIGGYVERMVRTGRLAERGGVVVPAGA